MFRSMRDVEPPKALAGDSVYIGSVPADKECIVSRVTLGKTRLGRKIYWTWFYSLRTAAGVGIVRPSNNVTFH